MSDGEHKNGNKQHNYGYLIGNKNAKKEWSKTMAQGTTWDELYWAARMITEVPVSEIKKAVESGKLENESLLTYSILSKASKGDFKPMQFLLEMICGKPKMYLDTNTNPDKNTINLNYKLRSKDEPQKPEPRTVENESESIE